VATVGNVNEVLEGHVVLDLECLDTQSIIG